ncbi:hypothetical protein [Campylobacter concisus]
MLVGNNYEVTQDGLLVVRKNALQRSGIKTISKQEFKKASDLSMINYARRGEYFITSYALTRIPEATWAGIGGWIASDPREQIKDTYFFLKKA